MGDWQAIWREGDADETGVVTSGPSTALDCKNTLLQATSEAQEFVAMGLEDIIVVAMQDMVDARPNGRPQLEELEYASDALRRFGQLVNEADRERRLHARYVGEARSERRKALRAWCDYSRGLDPNSRNELSANGSGKGKG